MKVEAGATTAGPEKSASSPGWVGTTGSDHRKYLTCWRPAPTLALGLAAARFLSHMGAGSKVLHHGSPLWWPGSLGQGEGQYGDTSQTWFTHTRGMQLIVTQIPGHLSHTDHVVPAHIMVCASHKPGSQGDTTIYYLGTQCCSHTTPQT